MIRNIIMLLASSTLAFGDEVSVTGFNGKSPHEVVAAFGKRVNMNSRYSGSFLEWTKTNDEDDYILIWKTLLRGKYKITTENPHRTRYAFSFKAKFYKPIDSPNDPWRCYSARYTVTDTPIIGNERGHCKFNCNPAFKCPHNPSYVGWKKNHSDKKAHGGFGKVAPKSLK